MAEVSSQPTLRPVDPRWVMHQGEQRLWLRDPLALSDQSVLLPAQLAPLITFLGEARTPAGIRAAFELRYGVRLPNGLVEHVLATLEAAALLEGQTADAARAAALDAYRAVPFRRPALAGGSYPADPGELHQLLTSYAAGAPPDHDVQSNGQLRGLITPHIDYARGGSMYAATWLPARAAAAEAELVVVFGTDHAGGPGTLTLTRQRYATPWGPFPVASDVVDTMATVLGEDRAFADELHHRAEHSIELAVVWLHWLLRDVGRGDDLPPLAPVLCGSFGSFTQGDGDPIEETDSVAALHAVREMITDRRTLVVASADLAHVGPAFGDGQPWDTLARSTLRSADQQTLGVAARGDPAAFLASVRRDGDARRICGLPPIYWALQTLGDVRGDVLGYAQCPADDAGGSWVSIAGMAYT